MAGVNLCSGLEAAALWLKGICFCDDGVRHRIGISVPREDEGIVDDFGESKER